MSRADNLSKKRKSAKRARHTAEQVKREAGARERYKRERLASGMPADVFALHKLLGGR